MRILWIVDGHGWGHDIQSEQIAERLPNYDHHFISRKRHPFPAARSGYLMERMDVFLERLSKIDCDIIMAMHIAALEPGMMLNAVGRLGMKSNGVEMEILT